MEVPLLTETRRCATDAGFDLVGIVCADAFDRCQPCDRRARTLLPGCGTVLVLGSGGRGFWDRMVQEQGRPRLPEPGYHPLQDYTSRGVTALLRRLGAVGHPGRIVFPDDKQTLNFVQLAEMAGFGTVSPVIGLLLHPEFGPWVSLRAAILLPGRPFGEVPEKPKNSFAPCLACTRPCLKACPADVHDGRGGVDLRSCANHRHSGHCGTGCEVRRACPVGAEHRYGVQEESHRHAYSLFTMRRYYGLGPWRFLPKGMRRPAR